MLESILFQQFSIFIHSEMTFHTFHAVIVTFSIIESPWNKLLPTSCSWSEDFPVVEKILTFINLFIIKVQVRGASIIQVLGNQL